MEIDNDINNLPYQLTQVLPSRGLAALARDGDGLLLDFYGPDSTTAIRLGIHLQDAQRMLAALQRLVDFLGLALVGEAPSTLH